ncbi:hypothetical protein [Paracoccus sp. (in: a-proteobacteria)]|uniref:hypothetical protein n=1 Tax=Paracoccus sp. TaxID=267 RepID=UPI0032200B3B
MAYSFPLSIAQFMDKLPIHAISLDLTEAVEMSETGGGEILTAELGARLWRGRIDLADMTPDEAADVLPLIDILRRPGASFMVHDASRPGPRLDADGATLGAAIPVLSQVASNNRDIRLTGLPPNYRLRPHDWIGFSYGSNPLRLALHRGVTAVQASAIGAIAGWWEITPHIRPGFATGTAVTLVKASCKAVIVPKSVRAGQRQATLTRGVSFEFIQTLR